jgi:hypothetical protein
LQQQQQQQQESIFFGCDHFHLVWVGSVRDTLINHSGRAFGGWYVLVWVLRGGTVWGEKSLVSEKSLGLLRSRLVHKQTYLT